MPRSLRVGRVTVSADDCDAYIRTVHALARLAKERGINVWLFRHGQDPGRFFEFVEGVREEVHHEPRSPEEAELIRRLEAIATYGPESQDRWYEVPAPEADD